MQKGVFSTRICSIKGCGKKHWGKNYCRKHYDFNHYHGDPIIKKITDNKKKIKHGMCHTPTYRSWQHMNQRCNNSNNDAFKNYGGRGITVCERWYKFENFFADMGIRPEKFQLERIDNNKGYSIDNCKWATPKENKANTRKTRFLEYGGVRLPMKHWAEKIGLNYQTLRGRLNANNLPIEKILSTSLFQGQRT